MQTALSSKRSWIARLAVLAMVASLMAIAAPAGAVIDTSDACPDTIPSAGFTDLAGVPAAAVDAIDCIVDYGISIGTSATTFDPFNDVERWQMALFLTRQAEVHGLTLPSGADQGFTDLAGVPAAAVTAINQIAQLDISLGTSATTFDPFNDVERWQMALFLTRLVDAAGVTLPSGADQGFTDLAGVPAAAVTAINQLAQLEISEGTSATTFDPFADVERWQMALFLTRTLQADGITPAPAAGTLSGTVTAFDTGANTLSVEASGTVTAGISYGETSDTYSIGGTAATLGAFEAALSIGDTIVLSKVDADTDWDIFALTNVTVTSGLVGAVDISADEFSIVTVGNNVLATFDTYTALDTAFSIGGASATFAQFEAALSHGDTVVVTPDSTDADTAIDAIALTNGSASGIVAGVDKATDVTGDAAADAAFKLGKLGDVYDDSLVVGFAGADTTFVATADTDFTQTYTVDGASVVFSAFSTALTNGDEVTYSRAGGTETFALVNKTVDTSFSGITVLDAINGNTLTYLSGSTVSTFDISTATTITVDGVLVALADVEAQVEKGLPIADAVSYNGTTKVLAFTNATSTPSLNIDDVVVVDNGSVAGETFDLLSGGVLVYDNLPATLGSPNSRYFVNGAQVTQAVYEDYLIEIDADTNTTGDSFQATLDGAFVEHRLTTTEVLP